MTARHAALATGVAILVAIAAPAHAVQEYDYYLTASGAVRSSAG